MRNFARRNHLPRNLKTNQTVIRCRTNVFFSPIRTDSHATRCGRRRDVCEQLETVKSHESHGETSDMIVTKKSTGSSRTLTITEEKETPGKNLTNFTTFCSVRNYDNSVINARRLSQLSYYVDDNVTITSVTTFYEFAGRPGVSVYTYLQSDRPEELPDAKVHGILFETTQRHGQKQ